MQYEPAITRMNQVLLRDVFLDTRIHSLGTASLSVMCLSPLIDAAAILNIPLRLNGEDFIVWSLEKSGT